MSFISYKTIAFIVLGGKKVKMNGIIALCVILAIIFISFIAVDISNTDKKEKDDDDKVSKHK